MDLKMGTPEGTGRPVPRPSSGRRASGLFAGVLLLLVAGPWGPSAVGQDTESAASQQEKNGRQVRDLTDLSVEELMNIEVTSVSRKEQPLSDTPAAITVIRPEDIRQTGSKTIADSLRMVPGMNVAKANSNTWAVSARGFNNVFSNKLEVRMDGRSAYSPLFSGVYWETFDTFLEDIDRIEVIRGPGGNLWGVNAVNGVVSVMTKSSKDTQGLYAYGGGGTELQAMGGARYGGQIDDNLYYRAYVKYMDWDEGWKGEDSWWQARAGFRTDYLPDGDNTITLQGDLYQGVTRQTNVFTSPNPPFAGTLLDSVDVTGGTIRARWEHTISDRSSFALQASYDQYRRDSVMTGELVGVADIDFQHRFPLLGSQDIIWGAGYRNLQDQTDNSFNTGFYPDHKKQTELTAFIQDEIQLIDRTLWLTGGCKFDHNTWTGFEYQPSVRMAWKPAEKHTLWTAVSRAVRIPSRADEDLQVVLFHAPTVPFPTEGRLLGNADMRSEYLTALELGYRMEAQENLSLDVALFHNWYKRLSSLEAGTPGLVGGTLVIPSEFGNNSEARTYGAEVAARWQPVKGWTLSGSYSFLRMNLTAESGAAPLNPDAVEGLSPRHQVYLRSTADLGLNVHWDLIGRIVSRLPTPGVDTYGTLDTRLSWDIRPNLQLSVVGQNLVDRHHAEFASQSTSIVPTDVERGGFIEVSAKF